MNSGLYIHIPFCLKKCGYCGFYSSTDLSRTDEFVSALLKEMELYRGFGPFDTVYFGGGTPSLLKLSQLDRIADRLQSIFAISGSAEWTIEINPGDLKLAYGLALRQCGFNRINIGVQSFDDSVLNLLGRRHTGQEALAAVENARAAGFDNMGLDLIYGVPGQDLNDCLADLGRLISFSPEHLSCYQLTIEEGTPISEQYVRGAYTRPDEETEIDYFLSISNALTRAGYIHYEVSNYARSAGLCSRHNQKYWDHTPYLGLGPAAHSFDGSRRWWNMKPVENYCRMLSAGDRPIAGSEVLTPEDLRLETLSLGLRTARGISISDYNQSYHRDILNDNNRFLEGVIEEGLVCLDADCLRPTAKGMAVADALARELAF